jgi:hypothetical protein
MLPARAASATHTRERCTINDWDFSCVMGSVLLPSSAIALPTAAGAASSQTLEFPGHQAGSSPWCISASAREQTFLCPGAGVPNHIRSTKLFQLLLLKRPRYHRIFLVPAITTICGTGHGTPGPRIDLQKGISCKLRLN